MADGSVPITAGSGTPIRALTNSGVQGGAFQQVFSLASADGTLIPADPDGTLQVSPEPTSLLVDDYSQAITTYHTTGGTAPTISGGAGTTSEGTTASAVSYLRSTISYTLRAATYLRIAHIITIESTATANNTRWWGYGQNQTTPTSTAPVLNGAVFILDAANSGALSPAIFSAGTKTTIPLLSGVTLTRDANPHRYQIDYRQSVIYWSIDGVVIAKRDMPQLAVAQGMFEIWGAANASTAPSAHTFLISSSSVADLGGNNRTISDGLNPGLQATVKGASTAIAATDLPLAVGLHPSSPLPGGSNTIGTVGLNTAQESAYVAVSTASTNAAVIKGSAGNLMVLTISNTTTTAAFVKLYNLAAAPTVGTSVPVATYRLAATGSTDDTRVLAFGTEGQRFTTGIAIAITGAVAATDTTATVAGIQVHASYI